MAAYEEFLKLKNDLVSAYDSDDLERVVDVLKALAAFEKIDETLIKKTKAGKVLKDMKSSFDKKGNKQVADEILEILKKWTKMAKQGASTKAAKGKKTESAAPASVPAPAPAPVPTPAILQVEKGPHRKKIIKVLADSLKGSAEGKNTKVDSSAFGSAIEEVINKKNPYDDDNFKNNVEYNSKVRSLVFNIKRNKDLANAVLSGFISPSELTNLTPNQLADKDLAMKRQQLADTDADARRTDWLDVHKADVLANCGVKEDENVQKLEEEIQEVSDDD